MKRMWRTCALAVCGCLSIAAVDIPLPDGVTINLRNPTYSDGILKTTEGGVVEGCDVRIQGECITAVKRSVEGEEQFQVHAENNLMLEYGDKVFIGSEIDYDFVSRQGYVRNARSAFSPWYMGADCIEFLSDGSLVMYNGYVTTSDKQDPDWRISLKEARLSHNRFLTGHHMMVRLLHLPLFYLPYLQTHLDSILDSPIRYRLRWGGEQGVRIGFAYKLFEWKCMQTFLRFDYRLSKGPGGALETQYSNPARCEEFLSRNYIARDSSVEQTTLKTRYRFQGLIHKALSDGKLTLDVSYDKLSDINMAADYNDSEFDLETGQLTQAHLRSQTDWLISEVTARVRINSFESVNEELPSITLSAHPFVLGPTGIISENLIRFGYYEFRYASQLVNVTNYNATRVEFQHSLYRPFAFCNINMTPKAGVIAIYYGNGPSRSSEWMLSGVFGGEVNSHFYRCHGDTKHIIEPYARYEYITTPNSSPDQHYIFGINDGWFRLNSLRFGTRQLIYRRCAPSVGHVLTLDLYTYAFYRTPTLLKTIPRVYGNVIWDATPRLRYTALTSYNCEHYTLDQLNIRTDWTLSDTLAFACEFRYRDQWVWRKADANNFIIDSFRTESDLLNSAMSDKRNTVLGHTFYRYNRDLAFDFQIRHGWNRPKEPGYTEYQFDILKTIRSCWNLKLSYQHRTDDKRFSCAVKIGLQPPKEQPFIPPCIGCWERRR